LIVVLWRAGLRIHEALALAEADLDRGRGALLVRRGKGGRRREVGMDTWSGRTTALARAAGGPARRTAFRHHQRPHARAALVERRRASGSAADGRRCGSPPAVCSTPAPACPRRRDGARGRAVDRHPAPTRPQQSRHHLDLPAGIDKAEIIETIHARRAPMIPRQRIAPALTSTSASAPLIALSGVREARSGISPPPRRCAAPRE
jgi:hypothetical protein